MSRFAMPLSALVLFCLAAGPAPVLDTVGARQVELLTIRHPASKEVIVFEGGARNTIERWGVVPAQLAREATVFAYNRPGYGHSLGGLYMQLIDALYPRMVKRTEDFPPEIVMAAVREVMAAPGSQASPRALRASEGEWPARPSRIADPARG